MDLREIGPEFLVEMDIDEWILAVSDPFQEVTNKRYWWGSCNQCWHPRLHGKWFDWDEHGRMMPGGYFLSACVCCQAWGWAQLWLFDIDGSMHISVTEIPYDVNGVIRAALT